MTLCCIIPETEKLVDRLIDFDSVSTRLILFYAELILNILTEEKVTFSKVAQSAGGRL